MSKFKIERNGGHSVLVIQGQKGQQISQREYYAISTGQIPGLLRAELIKKGNSFKLNYNISGLISLKEFLVNPLNKLSFAALLGNILENLKSLQAAYYNYQFILMDMNAAMVNPATQQVNFVYVPITFYESGTNLKDFLLSIIQCCSFVPGENTDYVRDYITILNRGINFSVFDLEEYVKELKLGENAGSRVKKCTRCGSLIQPNVNFCSSCGMKVSGLKIDNSQGVYDPVKNAVKPQPQEVVGRVIEMDRGVQYSETISGTCLETQPQPPEQTNVRRNAYLSRLNTGERIQIPSSSFKVGKDPFNCDYCIRDNTAISRCHILIKNINNRWFINDLNSTNKTYVNNMEIYPNMDVELFNGTAIKLANENFVFNIY